jgi:hypothetical protein
MTLPFNQRDWRFRRATMLHRASIVLGILGAGVVGGLAIPDSSQESLLPCHSDDECFDLIAVTQCNRINQGAGSGTTRQRSVDLPNVPRPSGVNDWVFIVFCDNAKSRTP